MNEGPPLVELSDIDSAFQLTEHLKALHFAYTNPPDIATSHPITRSTAAILASVPSGTDRSIWLYELCRFVVQKINIIMVSLFADDPPCSASTCPEMRASEWQYLCAVHDPPKSCCAIDYCCHTLDWAANTLTSPRHFPSRLSLAPDGPGPGSGGVTRQHQERQLTNIFRRVYRIFAHAWFQHRDVFWRVEGRTGLYVLFKTICDNYALIPDDNYTIPPEAEGLESNSEEGQGTEEEKEDFAKRHSIPTSTTKRASDTENKSRVEPSAVTARKHRSMPSKTGSSVGTVIEENEDEENTAEGGQEFPLPSRQSTAKPSAPIQSLPSHKPSVEYIGNLDDINRPATEGTPPDSDAATVLEPSARVAPSSTLGISPTSPHAMTSDDLKGARSEIENVPATKVEPASPTEIAESEEVSKAALTRAEGVQANTTEPAKPDDAAKTVED